MATEADALSTSHKQALSHGGKLALISLSDKTDLAFLGKGQQELGYTLVSTGGTASALEDIGLVVTRVEQLTSFPEMVRVRSYHRISDRTWSYS
ncbi:hypothetical protein MLD38_032492 [Melastoma candidum]|uniref:Uncharacterized protein n=1 Tax=Melastoma candidum TaxID=119954 RepID=A0ACB9M5S9_9MYRT|nr:hypothetical protein MLD38_032492 [Melastoma candidum]